jgi:polyhydroxyalkanoate synthesis regulator phasin
MNLEKTLVEQVKKALSAGVDLAVKTWDEVEAYARDLAVRTKLSETEAAKLVERLRRSWSQTQREVENRVSRTVKETLKAANVATGDEVQSLKREIQQLKRQLKASQAAPKAGKAKPAARARTAKKS